MPDLYIDIETLPSQASGALERAREGVKPPGQYKKPESIAGWWAAEGDEAVEQAWRRTALDGTKGEIAMVSWAIDDEPVQTLTRGSGARAEENLLSVLWESVGDGIATVLRSPYPVAPVYVGHNVPFDLRFLFQRSMIRRVKPSIDIPYNASAWSGQYYDTMYHWAGPRGTISLDDLAEALGIDNPYEGDITGATVWDAWAAGRKEELQEYNRADVMMVREIHKTLQGLDVTPSKGEEDEEDWEE